MEPETVRRLRGGVELVAAAVEAAAGASARTHAALARQVYAPFALLGPLAAPARVVEQIQTAITGQVYQSILAVNRQLSGGSLALLELQAEEAQPSRASPEPPREPED
jgi:hypothetical protein